MPKMSFKPAAACKRTILHGPAMGTRWSASIDADNALDLAALHLDLAAAVEQVDEQMSPWKPNSDLMRLNRAPVNEWVDLPDEILEVLDCALDVRRLSACAFDPYVGALVDAWGFGAVRDAPDAQAIRAARQSTPPLRTSTWRLIDLQAAPASVQFCNSTCAALRRATQWTAWPLCCNSTAYGMRWQRLMASFAAWALRPAASLGLWRWKALRLGAARCTGSSNWRIWLWPLRATIDAIWKWAMHVSRTRWTRAAARL